MTGSIVTFDDAIPFMPIEKLVANIEPQQDLHGYDAPWAGGAGKNILPLTVDYLKSVNTGGTWSGNAFVLSGVTFTVNTDNAGNVIGINVNGTASANTSFIIGKRNELLSVGTEYTFSGSPTDGSASTYCLRVANPSWTAIVGSLTITMVESTTNNIVIYVANGATCGNKDFTPMVCLSTATSPTTFAPYSNECPISGWTGLSGYKLNGNLFNGVFGTGETARVEIPSGATAFTVTAESTSAKNLLMRFYDSTGTKVGSDVTLISGGTSRNIRSVTIPSGATLFSIYYQSGGSASEFSNVCVGIGGTFSVSWQTEAGTVYGGTIDVVTGVLTADMGIKTELWKNFTSEAVVDTNLIRRQANISSAKGDTENAQKTISNIAPFVRTIADKSVHVSMASSGNYLYAILPTTTDPDLEITFCYPLATPQTYQLTPQQISTLLGNNTVFVDTGDVSVTYQSTSGSTPVRTSLRSPLASYSYSALKLFGNTFIEHGKG